MQQYPPLQILFMFSYYKRVKHDFEFGQKSFSYLCRSGLFPTLDTLSSDRLVVLRQALVCFLI